MRKEQSHGASQGNTGKKPMQTRLFFTVRLTVIECPRSQPLTYFPAKSGQITVQFNLKELVLSFADNVMNNQFDLNAVSVVDFFYYGCHHHAGYHRV